MDGDGAVVGGSGGGREGNDEHGYLYVGNSDGPKKRAQKAIASRKGRTRSCDHGVVCGRSKRNKDDMVEKGRKEAGVKRLRLGRKIIELSDDDEKYVVSEDVGDDEVAAEGGEEGSKGNLACLAGRRQMFTMYSFACSMLPGNLTCLPGRRKMFTLVNHGLQLVNLWKTDRLQS
ncbi:hypothetical protein Cgig2_005942 [Carnegiea gigantea]|uniref:Uncharacterized protein n=1 Tax=Carnegiea gigantea TaxID=171969 RepID=A0A9Q1QLH1_9CARY|nr:hypothetical protein Cgig2_005942 [Carnegiea gigantea]